MDNFRLYAYVYRYHSLFKSTGNERVIRGKLGQFSRDGQFFVKSAKMYNTQKKKLVVSFKKYIGKDGLSI